MSPRIIQIIIVSCTILISTANVFSLHQEVGLGVNLGFPQLIGADIKYLFAQRHQFHFSYLVPFVHGLALGVKTDLGIGYTYRFEEEGVYTHFGGQLRYWRFDLDDSVYGAMAKAFAEIWIDVLFGDIELTEADIYPVAEVLFLGPQFGVERRGGRSAFSFDLEILGTTLYTKWGEIEKTFLDFNTVSLFPYFTMRYTYYF